MLTVYPAGTEAVLKPVQPSLYRIKKQNPLQVVDLQGVMNGRYWTPNDAENTEKTAIGEQSGALCGARWGDIRDWIAVCDDLPDDVKKRLIEAGDRATLEVGSRS